MSSKHRQMTAFRRELAAQGFKSTLTNGGHWRFDHLDLSGPIFAPSTPSDWRSIKNVEAKVRRALRRASE